jgi:copper resistance protein B
MNRAAFLLSIVLSSHQAWAVDHATHQHMQQHQQTPSTTLRDPFAWSTTNQISHEQPHQPHRLYSIQINQLEWSSEQALTMEATAWIGNDDDRIILRADIEKPRHQSASQTVSIHQWHSLNAFWNTEWGVTWETANTHPSQTWLSIGLTGLAPYWVESGVWLMLDANGYSKAHLKAEYEARLTQDWVLYPQLALTAYGSDRPKDQIRQDLAQLDVGLRLGYRKQQLLRPYLGVSRQTALSATTDHYTQPKWYGLIGISLWY